MTQAKIDIKDALISITGHYNQLGYYREKPLIGGVFGVSGFIITSVPVVRNGLHSAYFAVMEQSSRLVVGAGETQAQALDTARGSIQHIGLVSLQELCRHYIDLKVSEAKQRRDEAELRQQEIHAQTSSVKVKSIPRRRRQIFEESEGKCHYCATPLTLDGRWHVEHKMPKALGGGNEPGNLVASCAPCNHKKLDRTDIEFIAMKKAGLA